MCAECLYVDPVADIALLRPPDSPDLGEQRQACERMMDAFGLSPFLRPQGVALSDCRRGTAPRRRIRRTDLAGAVVLLAGEWLDYPLPHEGGLLRCMRTA